MWHFFIFCFGHKPCILIQIYFSKYLCCLIFTQIVKYYDIICICTVIKKCLVSSEEPFLSGESIMLYSSISCSDTSYSLVMVRLFHKKCSHTYHSVSLGSQFHYTVKKECFETPLLVATQLQPILVFGNTILSRFETQRVF